MAKTTKYLIIACIVIVILLLAGLAYLQGTQSNNTAPIPTVTPTPAFTAIPTAISSSSALSTPPVIPTIPGMESHTPPVIPTSGGRAIPNHSIPTPPAFPTLIPRTGTPTPSVQASVSPTPTSTPVVDIDPYKKPWWPLYNKQYGPQVPMGTITVNVNHGVDHPLEGQSVGVLAGSYSMPGIIVQTTWVTTGADGSALLGSFSYGTYTVYYRQDSDYYQTEIIVISDHHPDWVVNIIAPR